MNERIRELAIQSGLPTALDYHQKRYEKFAELIVKECIQVAMHADNDDKEYAWFAIQRHFGVEE